MTKEDTGFEEISENEVEDANKFKSDNQELEKSMEKEDEQIQNIIEHIKEIDTEGLTDKELAIIQMVELKYELHEWAEFREYTIQKLREIADYVDSVSHKTGVAKIVSSGSGVLAGGMTIVGGALTIATMGALAVPVLIAGTSLGLTAGLAGGAAAITEKVIKSKQMKEAEEALARDKEISKTLENKVIEIRNNKVLAKEIKSQAMWSGAGAAKSSYDLLNLVGGAGLGQIGSEVVSKMFGEDMGKEISKLIIHTSGRVLSGAVTIVIGGATMFYDIYKLNSGLQEIAKTAGASEFRAIADQLEDSLHELCPKSDGNRKNDDENKEVEIDLGAEDLKTDCNNDDKQNS